MKCCFIINTSAGKGKKVDEALSSIKAAAQRCGADHDIFVSTDLDATKEYIRSTAAESDGEVEFIACGGDGTLCQTMLSIMALPQEDRSKVSLGLVPMGTGNDFASNFENKDGFLDFDAQFDATPFDIDLIKCNDVYSINMVNAGFDSHVVCVKEKIGKKKWVPRKCAYIFALLITLIKKPWLKVNICCDGRDSENRSLLLTTMANGAFCGGGFHSNPEALLVDGKIDFIGIRNVGRIRFLTLVGSYKKGTHTREKLSHIVDNFKCESVDMYFDKETPVSVDGEIINYTELHLSVERKAIRFMMPKGVSAHVQSDEQTVKETV